MGFWVPYVGCGQRNDATRSPLWSLASTPMTLLDTRNVTECPGSTYQQTSKCMLFRACSDSRPRTTSSTRLIMFGRCAVENGSDVQCKRISSLTEQPRYASRIASNSVPSRASSERLRLSACVPVGWSGIFPYGASRTSTSLTIGMRHSATG